MIQCIFVLFVFLQQNYPFTEAVCSTTTVVSLTTTTTPTPAVQFSMFQENFDIYYENDTVAAQKLAVFIANLNTIEQHNVDFEAGKVSFKLEVNKFADLVRILLYFILIKLDN